MKVALKYMSVIWLIVAVMFAINPAATDADDMLIAEIKSMFAEEVKLVPKVDNFIFLIDQSGSMYLKDQGQEEAKAKLTKEIITAMNERIPELGYSGTIQVFAPDKTLIGPREFNRNAFGDTIHNLPEKGKIFGNRTPLGDAILQLDQVVDMSAGETAVIIVSDGKGNLGTDALEAARTIHSKYPNASFYAVSLADEEKGRATLKEISKLGDGMYVDGGGLTADPATLDRFVGEVFYFAELEQVEEIAMMEETAAPEFISLETLYFDFDKYNLKPEARMALDRSIELMSDRPELTVVIQGYTDQIGTPEYNQKLSEWRARAVHEYFLDKGISAHRLDTIGYGESRPKTIDMSTEGRALNRRVEIPLVCNAKVQLAYCIVWPESPES